MVSSRGKQTIVCTGKNKPPTIIPRYICESINKHLWKILSDKEYPDKAKSMYQDTLNKSSYNYKLPYKETITPDAPQASRRKCQRNVTFDPPYRENVEMKVQKCFLSNQTFPKSNPLQKIFIRNTYRSYRSPPRVKRSMHRSLRHTFQRMV